MLSRITCWCGDAPPERSHYDLMVTWTRALAAFAMQQIVQAMSGVCGCSQQQVDKLVVPLLEWSA